MNRYCRWPLPTASNALFVGVAVLLIQASVAAGEPSLPQSVDQPIVFSARPFIAAIGAAVLVILALVIWVFRLRQQVAGRSTKLPELSSKLDDIVISEDVTTPATTNLSPAKPSSPQEMNVAKRLAKEAAHDFNNVLTVINWSLLTVSENTDEACQESIELMELATARIAELAEQLQGFAMLSRLDQTPIAVDRLLENTHSALNGEVEATVQFRIANCKANEFFVDVDDAKLQRSLINLCRFAHDGVKAGGELTLSVAPCDHATLGQCVCISVKDNGKGLSDEDQARIFEPYVTPQGGEGTGLELAFAQGVVEQHGGEIRVESEIGRYTEFQIVLPRCNPTTGNRAMNRAMNRAVNRAVNGKQRILVVDDDALIRESLALLLKELHHTVVIADSGAKAINLLASEPPFDMVLLDLTMPGMCGVETHQEIKSRWPNLRVVFCSGYPSDWSGFDAITTERLEVLSKPVQAKSLAALFS